MRSIKKSLSLPAELSLSGSGYLAQLPGLIESLPPQGHGPGVAQHLVTDEVEILTMP